MFSGWLTVAVFLPAATALVLVFMPRRDNWIRWTAIGATVVELGLTIGIFVAYDIGDGGVQMVDRRHGALPGSDRERWIRRLVSRASGGLDRSQAASI